MDIGLDPHARIFEPARALEMAAAVAPSQPFFFEEPLRPENIDALAWFAQKSPVPVATGEMLYMSFGFVSYWKSRRRLSSSRIFASAAA